MEMMGECLLLMSLETTTAGRVSWASAPGAGAEGLHTYPAGLS